MENTLFKTDQLIPLQNYPGIKRAAGVYQKIISEIPKCDLFIEAMCGSAYISSLLQNTGCSIVVNDIEGSVIDKLSYASLGITFHCSDYKLIIDRYDNGNTGRIFYFDPPYLMQTRKSQTALYNFDWDDKKHKQFISHALKIKSPCMISQYPNDLYDRSFRKWRQITYKAMTRAGIRNERLYMNFPQPTLLQCHKYVGDNYTDRQRIKRKVLRLINKLTNENPQERAAILSSIIDHFSYVISKPGE